MGQSAGCISDIQQHAKVIKSAKPGCPGVRQTDGRQREPDVVPPGVRSQHTVLEDVGGPDQAHDEALQGLSAE